MQQQHTHRADNNKKNSDEEEAHPPLQSCFEVQRAQKGTKKKGQKEKMADDRITYLASPKTEA